MLSYAWTVEDSNRWLEEWGMARGLSLDVATRNAWALEEATNAISKPDTVCVAELLRWPKSLPPLDPSILQAMTFWLTHASVELSMDIGDIVSFSGTPLITQGLEVHSY